MSDLKVEFNSNAIKTINEICKCEPIAESENYENELTQTSNTNKHHKENMQK